MKRAEDLAADVGEAREILGTGQAPVLCKYSSIENHADVHCPNALWKQALQPDCFAAVDFRRLDAGRKPG